MFPHLAIKNKTNGSQNGEAMPEVHAGNNLNPSLPRTDCPATSLQWYAVQTMPRHEKRVARHFEDKQVPAFLPLVRQIHRWSDRRKKVDVPLFSCYAFVRIHQTPHHRAAILSTPGVLGFVGSEGRGASIRDEEIESLQTALKQNVACATHPFIHAGMRVRIRGGSLDGVEGILERHGADQTLILSVELLRRSISIRVDGYDVELI